MFRVLHIERDIDHLVGSMESRSHQIDDSRGNDLRTVDKFRFKSNAISVIPRRVELVPVVTVDEYL